MALIWLNAVAAFSQSSLSRHVPHLNIVIFNPCIPELVPDVRCLEKFLGNIPLNYIFLFLPSSSSSSSSFSFSFLFFSLHQRVTKGTISVTLRESSRERSRSFFRESFQRLEYTEWNVWQERRRKKNQKEYIYSSLFRKETFEERKEKVDRSRP